MAFRGRWLSGGIQAPVADEGQVRATNSSHSPKRSGARVCDVASNQTHVRIHDGESLVFRLQSESDQKLRLHVRALRICKENSATQRYAMLCQLCALSHGSNLMCSNFCKQPRWRELNRRFSNSRNSKHKSKPSSLSQLFRPLIRSMLWFGYALP